MANLTCPTVSFPVDSTWRGQSNTYGVPLGTRAFASGGREYMFVKAGAAIAAKDALRFGLSATGTDDVRATSAANQHVIGAADGTAFASGDYGFMLTKGYTTVLATDSITAGATVISSATAGLLIAAAGTDTGNHAGVVLVTAANADTDGATVWMKGI
jgi:hypothetical protein